MKIVKHKELTKISKVYSRMNKSCVVLGRTGIGKSLGVKNMAKQRARDLGKEFVEWNKLTLEEKQSIVNSEENDKFIFIDIRLTMTAPEDLKGLPDLSESVTYWKPNMWSYVLSKNAGVLFLDEFNLVPPSIQSSVYQILLDQEVGEYPLHKETYVMCAGNLSEDKAGVYEVAKPIRTRAGFYELKCPTAIEWCDDYAMPKNLNSNTIMFLQRFKDKIFMESDKVNDVITPRSWDFVAEFTDEYTKGKISLEDLDLCVSGVLGEGIGQEYISFIKLKDKIPRPEDVISGKAKFPREMDLKYACVSSITEHYKDTETDKDKIEIIKKVADIKDDMGVEYFILLLRLFKSAKEDIIRNTLISLPDVMKKLDEYKKYLLE
jgi:hypothetical protein